MGGSTGGGFDAEVELGLSLLTEPEAPATVYVTAPFNELARLAPLLRVLVALLVYRLTDETGAYRDVALGDRRRVLLVLDEFATLGRIPLLEEVLAFLRGYGVTAMLAVQDIGQIHRLYSRSETFTGTCGIHVNSATMGGGIAAGRGDDGELRAGEGGVSGTGGGGAGRVPVNSRLLVVPTRPCFDRLLDSTLAASSAVICLPIHPPIY